MKWYFVSEYTLREGQTGFIINLLEGVWENPIQITPKAPKGMSFYKQARFLRLGLEFAEHTKQLESIPTLSM